MNDVILNKRATVERCMDRIREEYADEATLRSSFTKQDSLLKTQLRWTGSLPMTFGT